MKIGLFTDSYLPSFDGVATSVESCARELQRRGHTVYIIAPSRPHKKDRKNVIRLVSIRLIKTPPVWIALEIPQPSLFKVAGLEFDIIHGHSGGTVSFIGWQLAQLHNIPFVETYHTIWKYYRHYLPYNELIKIWMVKKIISTIGNDCDGVIAPTIKAKKELLSNGVRKPIYIVPNGIYLEKFGVARKDFLHNTYDIPDNIKIVLTVGRLEKEKSLDFLIKSFAIANKTCPDIAFVIVGEGHDKQKLRKLADSLGVNNKVYFIGNVAFKDMPKVYAGAGLFIFSSRTETQGMVVSEAMAAGLPVVVVEDEAFDDVITNGVNGFLVKKDKNVFARKIENVLNNGDLRLTLGNNAKKSAIRFSIHSTTKILEQTYMKIIADKKRNKKNLLHNVYKKIFIHK